MIPYVQHPSTFSNKEHALIIRETALAAERSGRLHEKQLDIIYKQQWLKMFVPVEHGGLGLSLPDILRLEEYLSWTDGSTAWVVTLCSGAGWFIGFMEPDIIDEIYKHDKCCIAGSGATTGIATINEHGYAITGSWKYASGSLHATAFTVNCYINKNGRQIYNDDGSPIVKSFLLKRDEVKILPSWNSMGMIATGSHSFHVSELQVMSNRCFTIDASLAKLKNPVYRFPFLQLAETTLAVNMSGMVIRFIDMCKSEFIEKKHIDKLIHMTHSAEQELNDLRNSFYNTVTSAYADLTLHHHIPESMLISISEVSQSLVQRSRYFINTLYPLCGLEAADTSSETNRIWRNFHTAGQHALFTHNM